MTRRWSIGAVALAGALLAACNGTLGSPNSMALQRTNVQGMGVAGGQAEMRMRAGTEMQSADRTVIRNASLGVSVADVAATALDVDRIVGAAGGRVTRTSNTNGNAAMTLRIPDPKLDATLDSLAALGTVKSRSISAEDVTAQVIDLDARIRALETSRDRLRALHERTNTVEEIISVERELARVQGELDSLQGRLRDLRGRADLSTVQLSLERKQVLGPLGVVLVGAGKLVSKLFVWR